jgi:DNA (cytosine-5)-methyltransferase 1
MREIIVDSFAGGGGASLGISLAIGQGPDVAINHDAAAIAMHAANHPETIHFTESVWKISPHSVVKGRPVGLLWSSPDCCHFSRAKGAKPVKKEIRSLAWVVIKWAAEVRPRVIILENVREFEDWGPLIQQKIDGVGQVLDDGSPVLVPDPSRKGHSFKRWAGRLRNLGYEVQWQVLDAADYGAPTHRRRLFLIARCDGKPIVWPEPMHGDPKKLDDTPLFGRFKPWRTAAECIDWSIPCPSIFDRKRPLAENTMRRIAMGIKRYVLENSKPFIVQEEPLRTATTGNHAALVYSFLIRYFATAIGQHCTEPLFTITGKDRFGLVTVLVDGELYVIVDIGMRMLTPRELARAQGFPDSYVLTGSKSSQVARIGNSVCPLMAKSLVEANFQIQEGESGCCPHCCIALPILRTELIADGVDCRWRDPGKEGN